MKKYIFTTKINLGEEDYIIFREPTTAEIDGFGSDNKRNLEIIYYIFSDCIVDSSIINEDGSKVDKQELGNFIKSSYSLYNSIVTEWISHSPFSISETEEIELRQVANMVFSGDNPLSMPETQDTFYKYKTILELFLISCDKRTGNIIHLPFDIDLYFQPSKTMSFYRVLQSMFIDVLQASLKSK